MAEPPVIQAELPAGRKAAVGRIGLYISLAPLAALAIMMLFRPG